MTSADEARGLSRRGFLGAAAGLTGVAVASGAWRSPASALDPDRRDRPSKPGLISLTLDGAPAGFLGFAEVGTSVDYFPGNTKGYLPGNTKYSNIKLGVAATMDSSSVHEWIAEAARMKRSPRSGVLKAADPNGRVYAQHEFKDALITEVGFPPADGAAKDPAYLSLELRAASAQPVEPVGTVEPPRGDRTGWLPQNFRLAIDGVDCSRVNKIEAITIKQKATEAMIEIGALKAASSEVLGGDFSKWFEDFVARGTEKNGSLEFLDATRQKVLLGLTLSGLGIFKITTGFTNNTDKLASATAEMYIEGLEARFNPR